jgi:hypothetical protein
MHGDSIKTLNKLVICVEFIENPLAYRPSEYKFNAFMKVTIIKTAGL